MKHSKMVMKNIKVKFHGHTVQLADEADRKKTPEGVEIWIEQKPANGYRPMADIPEGTLPIFMHCRPEIISCKWEKQS